MEKKFEENEAERKNIVEQLVFLIDILNLFSSIQFILRDSSGKKNFL